MGLPWDGKITKALQEQRNARRRWDMLGDVAGDKRVTVGTDKAYDTHDFVDQSRQMNATPHVTQNTNGRSSAIDGRTHPACGIPAELELPSTHRRNLRLAENSWRSTKDSLSRRGVGRVDV